MLARESACIRTFGFVPSMSGSSAVSGHSSRLAATSADHAA